MGKRLELTGERFGRLIVNGFAGISRTGYTLWDCTCDCGKTHVVKGSELMRGSTQSCGCYNKDRYLEVNTKHGHNRRGAITKTHHSWNAMLQRCDNPKNSQYKYYGGRGIKVCDEWRVYINFLADMGECPPGKSLDRKDNEGDYNKENCRWATSAEQSVNKRSNRFIEYKGETRPIVHWVKIMGISREVLSYRLNSPLWSIEEALTTPVRGREISGGGYARTKS